MTYRNEHSTVVLFEVAYEYMEDYEMTLALLAQETETAVKIFTSSRFNGFL